MNPAISAIVVTFALASSAWAAVEVQVEQTGTGRGDWDKPAWAFKNVHQPSQSAASRQARISIVGQAEASCLNPAALDNGVMPRQTRLRRDFFAFANGTDGGTIVMDLGQAVPVAEVNSYSAHGPVGGTTWAVEFDGVRGPQVYTLYGSAEEQPDPANLDRWTQIADVDTRPKSGPWGGRWGVSIHDDKGGLLGKFRWLAWRIRPTLKTPAEPHPLKPGQTNPEWSNTWYAELDVHTPETLPKAGDFAYAGTRLREVVVAYKSHFDIGFTHPAPEIVGIYRTSMIDRALGMIDASRKRPPEERFAWTIPSWVAYQILWDGQDPQRLARIKQAMAEGSLVIHGYPVTTHTETLDLGDLVAGLNLQAELCRKAGIPMSRSGKMTDVPSHSWVLPTLFRHAGMEFLHIGANPGNEKPDLPLLYDWEGPDGSRLLVMHNQGYGSDNEFGHGLYPPKDWPYSHWLAMMTACDNAGPPSDDAVRQMLGEARRNLPGVKVSLGTMDQFADAIRDEQKAGAVIPVVRADMPDCWIHGAGTMPQADAVAHDVRTRISGAESLDTHLAAWGLPRPDLERKFFAARERSLMYGEHTWGSSRNLEGRNAYAMPDFESFVKTDGTCKFLEKTWQDHADYILKAADITGKIGRDAMAQLAAQVAAEGRRAVVFNPLPWKRDALATLDGVPVLIKDLPPSGYKAIALGQAVPAEPARQAEQAVLENRFLKVAIDRARGGIVSIVDKETGRELADPAAGAFGQYVVEKFDRRQCESYQAGCVHLDTVYESNARICFGWNVRKDLPATPPYSATAPAYASLSVQRRGAVQAAILAAPPAGPVEAKVKTTVSLPDDQPWLEIEVSLEDKKPNYWPESGTLRFPVKAGRPQFRIGRNGSVVDPATDFAKGSNRTYGYVSTGAMVADADGQGVAICPLDQGIMSFGDKGLFSIDPTYVPTKPLACLSIFNNLWTTNFPYWIRGSVTSRVRVWPIRDLKPESLVVPALEARCPAFVGIADGQGGRLPATQSGLAFSRPGVRMVEFVRQQDGGVRLCVWEQAGVSGELAVTLPAGAPFTSAQPVTLRGEAAGQPVRIEAGRFSFPLPAYAPATFVLTPGLPSTAASAIAGPRKTTRLADLDLAGLHQGWGTPQKDKSVGGSPLKIGGVDHPAGLGTHAPMDWEIDLQGQGVEFSALVGMQDLGVKGKGSVEFLVFGDDRLLFKSGVLRSGDPAVPVKVSLLGVDTLRLQVADAGDGNSADHADWIAPEIVHVGTLK